MAVTVDAVMVLPSPYLFDSHFCSPGKGNEKGSVENLVGYARRNFLVPLPEVRDLVELNEYLLNACLRSRQQQHPMKHASTVGAIFEQEQPALAARAPL